MTLRPDRVAAYSFAFVPWMSAHMKKIDIDALPPAETKLALLAATVDAFAGAGYQQIGMDHFALPTDELARAIDTRTLNRNFMGYTVKTTTDMVAMGVSAIGNVQGAFVQNTKKLPEYYEAVAAGQFPIERGYELDRDDEIRRYVITELMCNFRLDIAWRRTRFGIDFADYFAEEMAKLTAPEDSPVADGLVIAVEPPRPRRGVHEDQVGHVRQRTSAWCSTNTSPSAPAARSPSSAARYDRAPHRRGRGRHHRPRHRIHAARTGEANAASTSISPSSTPPISPAVMPAPSSKTASSSNAGPMDFSIAPLTRWR